MTLVAIPAGEIPDGQRAGTDAMQQPDLYVEALGACRIWVRREAPCTACASPAASATGYEGHQQASSIVPVLVKLSKARVGGRRHRRKAGGTT